MADALMEHAAIKLSDSSAASRWPRIVCLATGGYAVFSGVVTLIGWAANIPRMTDLSGTGITMFVNTAIAAILTGVGLILLSLGRIRTAALAGSLAALLGLVTLFQHATGIDLGIDSLLWPRDFGALAAASPHRMGVPASFSFFLLGVGVALVGLGNTGKRLVPALGLTAVVIAGLSIVGYVFGSYVLYSVPYATGISLQTSMAVLALGIGLLASRPDTGPVGTLCEDSTAGVLARRTLPLLILVPIFLGGAVRYGQGRFWFDAVTGTALRSLVEIALLTFLLWLALGVIRRHEAERRTAHKQLEGVLASITDLFQTLDSQFRYTYHNTAVRRRMYEHGLNPDATLGKSLFEVFPEMEGTQGAAAVRRAMAERVEVTYENDTSVWGRWYNIRAAPTHDGGLSLMATDITERKRAEMNLNLLAAVSQRLISLTSVEEVTDDLGPIIGAHFGLSRWYFSEIDETNNTAVVARDWRSGDLAGMAGTYRLAKYNTEEFRKLARTGETIVVRDVSSDPRIDGPQHTALGIGSMVGVPLSSNGRWRFMLVFIRSTAYDWRVDEVELMREVTTRVWTRLESLRAERALRESEERFRTLADNMSQFAWTADSTGEVHWYNRRWFDYTGTTLEEMKSLGLKAVLHPDHLDRVAEKFAHHVQAGLDWEDTFPLRGKNGEYRWFLSRAAPIRDEHGNVVQWFGTNTDVTEQRDLEQELARHKYNLECLVEERTAQLAASNADLRRAERLVSMGALTAGLGHDLANLMFSVRMHMDALARRPLVPQALDDLAQLRNAMSYLQKLANGLRQLASNPDAPPPPEGTDLEKWCGEVTGIYRAVAPRRTRIECTVAAGLPLVNTSPGALTQAVFNLVQNAAEALTLPGAAATEGLIRVSAAASTAHKGWVTLTVSDNGPGMSPEVLAHCFEPYFSTKGRAVTTGMGLALVRSVVETAGGTIDCTSKLGVGTTFLLHLPPARAAFSPSKSRPRVVIDISEPRMAAVASALLRSHAVDVKRGNGTMPMDAELWLTDRYPSEHIEAFIRNDLPEGATDSQVGSARCVVVLRDGEDVSAGGGRVIHIGEKPSSGAVRAAIERALDLGNTPASGEKSKHTLNVSKEGL